jgi:hypothetical protein
MTRRRGRLVEKVRARLSKRLKGPLAELDNNDGDKQQATSNISIDEY